MALDQAGQQEGALELQDLAAGAVDRAAGADARDPAGAAEDVGKAAVRQPGTGEQQAIAHPISPRRRDASTW